MAATALWAYVLLGRTPGWLPWLRAVVVLCGLAAAAAVLAGPALARLAATRRGRIALTAAPVSLALIAALAGPAAYSIDTAATAHTGALPSAGPRSHRSAGLAAAGPAGRAGFGRGQVPGGRGSGRPGRRRYRSRWAGWRVRRGRRRAARWHAGRERVLAGLGARRRGRRGGGTGGPGGLGGNTTVASALTRLLTNGAAGYRWAAATVGSESAAPLQLASGKPVMAIGGFNGTDGTPTLAQFERMVAAGEMHYFVGANQASFGGSSGLAAQITAWVRAHFTAKTVGGVTVYDLAHARA